MLVATSQTTWCQHKRQQLNLQHHGILRFYICCVVSLVVRLKVVVLKVLCKQHFYQLKCTLMISENQLVLFIDWKSCLMSYMQIL